MESTLKAVTQAQKSIERTNKRDTCAFLCIYISFSGGERGRKGEGDVTFIDPQ